MSCGLYGNNGDFDAECKTLFGNDWTIDGEPMRGTCLFGQEQSKCKKTT